MVYFLSRLFCICATKLLFGIRMYGRLNVPKKGGVIIASNHASFLDPIAIGVSCPRHLDYMARESLFKNKVFGWLICACNTFPIKRGLLDLQAMNEAVRRIKKSRALLIFPEGTRTTTGELGAGKPGMALIANLSQAAVIPTYVKGTFQAWPKGKKTIKLSPIRIYFGKAVYFKQRQDARNITREEYQEFTDNVMAKIAQLKEDAE